MNVANDKKTRTPAGVRAKVDPAAVVFAQEIETMLTDVQAEYGVFLQDGLGAFSPDSAYNDPERERKALYQFMERLCARTYRPLQRERARLLRLHYARLGAKRLRLRRVRCRRGAFLRQ